jgi:hypothetical protein
MEGTTLTNATPEPSQALVCRDEGQASPFAEQCVTITKQEHIELNWRANYWEAQHSRVKTQLEEAKQEIILWDAKIKDLQNRLFGKNTEKDNAAKSEKGNYPNPPFYEVSLVKPPISVFRLLKILLHGLSVQYPAPSVLRVAADKSPLLVWRVSEENRDRTRSTFYP